MNKVIVTAEGEEIVRRSRWIRIQQAYDVTSRHSCYYYVTDGYGRRRTDKEFDPSEGTFLDYFVWNGRKWAIDRFLRFGTQWCPQCITWEENGETHAMAGYDSEEYFNPIMIEIDNVGENVRVYERSN